MRLLLVVCLGAALTGPARAGEPVAGGSEPPKEASIHCQVAEVNPVTGHVFCIKPLGAPVEAPAASENAPCKPDRRTDAVWSWGPQCNRQPERAGS